MSHQCQQHLLEGFHGWPVVWQYNNEEKVQINTIIKSKLMNTKEIFGDRWNK